MTAFFGLRGTGDWATDQRPYKWRESILRLYPNGSAPLTALLSKMSNEETTDPQFHWWTKTLPSQSGTVTGVYTDAALSSAYASGGTAGQVLYVKMTEADADEFRVGHQVLLRDASDYTVDVNTKVSDLRKNGASSYIACKLLEDDDNSSSHDLSDCDTALIVGSINSEGAATPDSISYDPVKYYNYTQIFRTPLDITRTARQTKLRTGDSYKEAKMECLELHSIEMEKAFFWGIATENVGGNGKPERTTQGVIPFIRANAEDNCDDFTSTYSGSTWLEAGEDWLNSTLEQIFRYGNTSKLAYCGSGALLGINKLASTYGNIQITPGEEVYGIKVTKWLTPFGELVMKTHPLFSLTASNRNSMVIVEPAKLNSCYIQDTIYRKGRRKDEVGDLGYDGTKEEYLTEIGLELHHPLCFGYLNGVGVNG